jgi:ATP-dependent helicase/nuclease subunit B
LLTARGELLIGPALSVFDDRRVFLPWDQPFLGRVVDWLLEDRSQDLSRTVAVVATAQAGRRLREALAVRAARDGRAIFPPKVVEPEGLLRLLAADQSAPLTPATRLESLVAWARVLSTANLEEYRGVFPIDPPAANFAWAVRIGQQLLNLQSEIAEQGLRCGDVARQAAEVEDFPERVRWRHLADLEGLYDAQLAEDGRIDPQSAKIRVAARPAVPSGTERIVLLALPDPVPLALNALTVIAGASTGPDVKVVVAAPESERENFDAWGRPIADRWNRRPLPWADFAQQVRLLANPAAQAEAVASAAKLYGENRAALAVGCPDAEIVPPLEHALAGAGIPSFNPEGRLRRTESFYHLVGCLADFVREGTFDSVEATGRCVDILEYLRRRIGPSQFVAAQWMAGLDELRAKHLPSDLDAARRHAPDVPMRSMLVPGLAALGDLRELARNAGFAEGVSRLLAEIFSGRRDAAIAESASVWMEWVRACGEGERRTDFRPADWWDLALRLFGESRRPLDKPPGAVEIQGWIELLWENAPHLVIAGLNEGAVPSRIGGDSFLPQALRIRLGLKTDADRLARDAYLLRAFAQSRSSVGRLDILVGRSSAQGDPIKPSRLLFLCEDRELPARVRELFRALPPAGDPRPWTRAWQLEPGRPMEGFPSRLSVTALKDWLDCPFRFYLRRGLGMEAVDAGKSELNAMDFGTLCHAALQSMGEEAGLRECTDPKIFENFLLTRLDEEMRATYGGELSLPLIVQVESARQRLRRVAQIHALEQASGWRIEAVERKFEFQIADITIVAKIDRIDRHRESGAVRVLDYKTSDDPLAPADAHLRGVRRNETPRSFAVWTDNGKTKVWKDLQLPLYRHALAAEFPDLQACGYINLPKAVSASSIELWEPYSLDLQSSAMACAVAVCEAIRSGEFWPPNEESDSDRDPFAALFHHGAADSVRWRGVP